MGYDISIRGLMMDIRGTAMTRINEIVADADGRIDSEDQLAQLLSVCCRVNQAEDQLKRLYIKLSRICDNM